MIIRGEADLPAHFTRIDTGENLHDRTTRTLALRIIAGEPGGEQVLFPNEAALCQQLGVSRSILREAVKVLTDKGMLEVRPRLGTRAKPRSHWNLLDPDILAWQAQLHPEPQFLRDLCEVRLAIEPTAAGFAALRATTAELARIGLCLERWEVTLGPENLDQLIGLDLQFHEEIMAASHNVLLQQLSATIRQPFRTALSYTSRLPASAALDLAGRWALFEAIRLHDPLSARSAAEEVVGLAMLAVEQVIRFQESQTQNDPQSGTGANYHA